MTFQSDVQKLEVTGKIRLFELDATKYDGPIFRFHALANWSDFDILTAAGNPLVEGTSYNRETMSIFWQGQEYLPVPIELGDVEISSRGPSSSISLTIANTIDGQKGVMSAYCRLFNDFSNCELRIINTFAKYLDAINFPNGNDNASNECLEQVWYVNQRKSENLLQITFELTDPTNLVGMKIPMRDITTYCHWALIGGYRMGEGCNYTGSARFTSDDEPTDDPAQDICGGRFKSCELRFGTAAKPFGGFVASNLIKG